MESGEQCVIIDGVEVMQQWSADNLDSQVQVLLCLLLSMHFIMMTHYILLTGAIAFNLARFGQGGGRPIFLSDVMCRGVEYRLIDCVHRDIEDNSCSHSEDAGVRCVAGKGRIVANIAR